MSTLTAELQQRLAAAIETHGLLPRGSALGIALSGGRDSVCLAGLLCALQPWGGWRLQAIHFDHGLRGPEAGAQESSCCEAVCRRLGLLLSTERLEIRGKPGESLEEAARNARLAGLRRQAVRLGLAHIATAHQADDRVETLLFRLLRGTGVRGLPGINWRRTEPMDASGGPAAQLTFHRPLLGIWRHEITEYCRAQGLPWVDDASNETDVHTRNRIRRGLMPKLEEFNPAARQHLWALAQDAEEWLAHEPPASAAQAPAPDWATAPAGLSGLMPTLAEAMGNQTAGEAAKDPDGNAMPVFPFAQLPWVLDGATLLALGRVRAIAALQQILETGRRIHKIEGAPGRRHYEMLWALLQDPAGPSACDLPAGFRVRRQGTPPTARLVIERPA